MQLHKGSQTLQFLSSQNIATGFFSIWNFFLRKLFREAVVGCFYQIHTYINTRSGSKLHKVKLQGTNMTTSYYLKIPILHYFPA